MSKTTQIVEMNPAISGWCQVTLHTYSAQQLFTGDWQKRKIGLIQFVRVIRMLHQQDNNTCATVLKEIQTHLQATTQQLQHWQQVIITALPQPPGMIIHPDTPTKQTQTYTVQFGHPEAWQATRMLIEYDRLR